MYVGVKLSAVQGGNQNVILYYTEPDSQQSYEAARFPVPSMKDTWTRFAIAVRDEKVMFYHNCDTDPQVTRIERSPDEMELEAGAGVFVGQAGGADPDKFLVGTQSLSVCNIQTHDSRKFTDLGVYETGESFSRGFCTESAWFFYDHIPKLLLSRNNITCDETGLLLPDGLENYSIMFWLSTQSHESSWLNDSHMIWLLKLVHSKP